MAKQSFTGELLHFGAIRYRLTGSGAFKSTFFSLDDVESYDSPDITMQAASSQEPTILANFIQQRGYIYGRVESIDYRFTISKIVIYVRPVATGYPG